MKAASLDAGAGGPTQPIDIDSVDLSQTAKAIARSLRGATYSPVVLAGLVRLAEWLLIFSAGAALYALYLWGEFGFSFRYAGIMVGVSTSTVLLFQVLGLYTPYGMRSVGYQGLRLVAGWTVIFALMLAVGFFSNVGDHISRVWVALWFAFGMLLLMVFRGALVALVSHWNAEGRMMRHAALVGSGPDAENLVEALRASTTNDVNLVGFFDDRGEERSDETCAGLPNLGTVDDLVAFARLAPLDLVIVTLPVTAENRVLDMVRKLWVLPIDVRLSAHTAKLRFRPRAYSYIGNVPFFAVFDRPLADWDHVAKAVLDRVVGLGMLIGLAPVMALVALAVKLDSKGPVLFKQKRFGFNNEPIEVYKFRSMYTDKCDPNAAKVVTKDDPRVTRVGAFIRKTSLDELPQLFNVVFKGDLSLVGPRPHAVQGHLRGTPFEKVIDGYFARHRVKPGMTGWAQVNGWRGEMDTMEKFERRVEHDLYYIENWSLLLDLQIIAITPLALLTKNENAY
ncbi:MAG: undecaprenyl-phosphate glucose phosphotransferase [Devosiaceae bacterium]|nr:undecaprenyl-phosphate glucose phosphotransferase [Devosiaceae bacterium MH13]